MGEKEKRDNSEGVHRAHLELVETARRQSVNFQPELSISDGNDIPRCLQWMQHPHTYCKNFCCKTWLSFSRVWRPNDVQLRLLDSPLRQYFPHPLSTKLLKPPLLAGRIPTSAIAWIPTAVGRQLPPRVRDPRCQADQAFSSLLSITAKPEESGTL